MVVSGFQNTTRKGKSDTQAVAQLSLVGRKVDFFLVGEAENVLLIIKIYVYKCARVYMCILEPHVMLYAYDSNGERQEDCHEFEVY